MEMVVEIALGLDEFQMYFCLLHNYVYNVYWVSLFFFVWACLNEKCGASADLWLGTYLMLSLTGCPLSTVAGMVRFLNRPPMVGSMSMDIHGCEKENIIFEFTFARPYMCIWLFVLAKSR